MPFAFLEMVKNEFRDKYGEKARTAQAGSLDRAFGCVFILMLQPHAGDLVN